MWGRSMCWRRCYEPESVAGVILESAGMGKEEVREWIAVISNRVVAVE